MEIFLVYGLVIVFFVALPFVVIFCTRDIQTQEATAPEQNSTGPVSDKVSYGILIVVFALIFLLTLATQRSRT